MASRRGALVVLAVMFAAAAAVAHPMLIIAGKVWFGSGAVWVSVERDDAGLDHFGLDPDDDGSWTRFSSMLSESIAVTDASGERLPGYGLLLMPIEGDSGVTGVSVQHDLSAPSGAVSLRLLPGSPLAERGAQVHLRGPMEGAPSVRLSPGGAPSTVRDPSVKAPTDAAEAWVWDHRFDRVLTLIGREGERVSVDVVVPLPVMETWTPVARASEDAVTTEEAAPVLGSFAEMVRDKVTVRIGGEPMAMRIERTGLLAPNEARLDGLTTKGRLGFWSACAVVRLVSEDAAGGGPIELEWALFNSAVKRAYALRASGPTEGERVLTPYEAAARWE